RLMAGKRYTNARAAVDRERTYPPLEAVRTLKSLDTAKFDETVEVHMRLGVNVRHADQQLRGTLFLPHGTGRSVTVAVFAQGKKAYEERALVENYGAVLDEILRSKPAAAKGRYLRSITLSSTMGPGVKIDTGRVRDLLEETAGV